MENTKLDSFPPKGIHGTLIIPGDKSISHRALMIGAISEGKTRINHFLWSEDCKTTMNVLQQLGVFFEKNDSELIVHGVGFKGLKNPVKPLEMGNSGTTTRLLMGLLGGTNFSSILKGDSSLSKRPMDRVAKPLSKMGIKIEVTKEGTLPAVVKGGKVKGTTINLQIASAQVKSAVIFAALQANTETTIVEKLPTRNHTELMLQQFGAKIVTEKNQKTIHVEPTSKLSGQVVNIPGDISSAAFFIVAATIIPNSKITLRDVSLNPTRTGILNILKKMNADIKVRYKENQGESYGDIEVKSSKLNAIEVKEEDIPSLIDELPLVALLAACAKGTSVIKGAAELRVKETDRIATVTEELSKLGVDIKELSDGMIIKGMREWEIKNNQLNSHGDHRIGMMLAIAALRTTNNLYLKNANAIAISYPSFFSDLKTVLNEKV